MRMCALIRGAASRPQGKTKIGEKKYPNRRAREGGEGQTKGISNDQMSLQTTKHSAGRRKDGATLVRRRRRESETKRPDALKGKKEELFSEALKTTLWCLPSAPQRRLRRDSTGHGIRSPAEPPGVGEERKEHAKCRGEKAGEDNNQRRRTSRSSAIIY